MIVAARRAIVPGVGSLAARRERLLGRGRQGRGPSRPEFVARYGHDVTYASRALGLALQGLEIVRAGRLTLPMPPAERERVPAAKRGDVPVLAAVPDDVAAVQMEIGARLPRSPLREEPDPVAVNAWAVSAHRRHRGWASA